MKWIIIETLAVAVVIVTAIGLGQEPTRARWGAPGVASMWAATWMCVAASIAAVAPVVLIAAFVPKYLAQTVLAGTAIRILVTGGLALLYQMSVDEHLPSLLTWLLVLYLPLLAVETFANVMLIRSANRRAATAASASGESAANGPHPPA